MITPLRVRWHRLHTLLALLAAACSSQDSSSELSSDFPKASNAGPPPSVAAPAPAGPGAGEFSAGTGMAPSSGGAFTPGASSPPAVDDRAADGDTASAESGQAASGGVLTAGTWDDNRNFERFEEYRADNAQLWGAIELSDDEVAAAHSLFSGPVPHDTLDIALIVDTTGSMGDEIAFLRDEFLALSRAIDAAHPNAAQRWSLVAYRDRGDAYLVQSSDFASDTAAFRTQLAGLAAGGGGDIPEAPEAAFEAAQQLDWRSDAKTARLVFWLADAPHHPENAAAMADGLRAMLADDVHVYPVASSGVEAVTEHLMRSAAQLTGGRYLFLTDDSGVGDAHAEPSIPCYFVTQLDKAILRMVDIELSGTYREPAAADVIRTGGDPQDGACELASGATALAY